MSQPSQTDIISGLDPTGFSAISGAQLETMVGSATPFSDKGLIVVTTDSAGVPQVPDATTTTKWQSYLWLRLSPLTTSFIVCAWNPAQTYNMGYSDGSGNIVSTNWNPISSGSIPAGSIQGYQIAAGTIDKEKIQNIDISQVNNSASLLTTSTISKVVTGAGAVNGSFASGLIMNNGSATLAILDTTGGAGTVLANTSANTPVWSNAYPTLTTVQSLVPPSGSIVMFAGENVPAGWLECNGAGAIPAATYPNLATALVSVENAANYIYGGTVAGGTFTLPDLRGQFVRGWNHGAGIDPDAATRTNRGDGVTGDHVGTKQVDGFKSHVHSGQVVSTSTNAGTTGSGGSNLYVTGQSANTGATGGNETRPINVYMMFIIKT